MLSSHLRGEQSPQGIQAAAAGRVTAPLASRLRKIPPSVFGRIAAVQTRTGAINFGQGFPDQEGPPQVVEAVVTALRSGRNQYAPVRGDQALREAVARHQESYYALTVDPDTEVVVTTGASEAIASALLGLVEPGDEVVVLEPYYDAYAAGLDMVGAVRRPVLLAAPDFRLDEKALRAAVTARTSAIIVNSPHNPTGRTLTRDELDLVAAVARENDLIVITDEVYEHITFDGRAHIPLATLPGMWERTLTISGSAKSFSFTGWKVGWTIGPEPLVSAVLAAKQWLTFTTNAPAQAGIAVALTEHTDYLDGLGADLAARRDLLCEGLAAAGLPVFVPEGTYYTLTDVGELGWDDALQFCLALPERAGVIAVPVNGFYDDPAGGHMVRWAFCKHRPLIEEGMRRLGSARLRR
ncbi:aminotransferase class I/II-fold pyridoxal phosphate-dependent enzyme [Nonomuraea cavernae]|uniref:Aminotransferase n=1 Tax=Nonomuraea cavernae TaxID=2045107 RepID=A0A918DFB9_9ACTN|nr:aminotransferase class I/II-fold pyridoxal phosphate-dependent enzyme [Nonomuraea cavernae]MCA2183590.1 aminotransferase class I/II-fold pyridoxal phosphate-dependent enzyme [Nonomuraea cavernae]GGO60760.1 aminotransferase [Nonomuraea cavernae]